MLKRDEVRPAPAVHLGWMSLLAAAAGAVAVVLLRQDPFANPDSHAFEADRKSVV